MDKVTDKALDGIIDDPTGVNSETVLAIATELREFRWNVDAVPPDMQISQTLALLEHNRPKQIQDMARYLQGRKGAQFVRFAVVDGRVYLDGWLNPTAKPATFKKMKTGTSGMVLVSHEYSGPGEQP